MNQHRKPPVGGRGTNQYQIKGTPIRKAASGGATATLAPLTDEEPVVGNQRELETLSQRYTKVLDSIGVHDKAMLADFRSADIANAISDKYPKGHSVLIRVRRTGEVDQVRVWEKGLLKSARKSRTDFGISLQDLEYWSSTGALRPMGHNDDLGWGNGEVGDDYERVSLETLRLFGERAKMKLNRLGIS